MKKNNWITTGRCILGRDRVKGKAVDMVYGCKWARNTDGIARTADSAIESISEAFFPDLFLPCQIFVVAMLKAAIKRYSDITVKGWIEEAGL